MVFFHNVNSRYLYYIYWRVYLFVLRTLCVFQVISQKYKHWNSSTTCIDINYDIKSSKVTKLHEKVFKWNWILWRKSMKRINYLKILGKRGRLIFMWEEAMIWNYCVSSVLIDNDGLWLSSRPMPICWLYPLRRTL